MPTRAMLALGAAAAAGSFAARGFPTALPLCSQGRSRGLGAEHTCARAAVNVDGGGRIA